MNKSTKNKNDNTTTSPAPAPAPAQEQQPVLEVPAFKQKLAMASDVISGHLNSLTNSQINQFPNNVKDYSLCTPQLLY